MMLIVVEVGSRAEAAAAQAGLTLEEFAAQSGVSRAMLSKVERGEKSPTLGDRRADRQGPQRLDVDLDGRRA